MMTEEKLYKRLMDHKDKYGVSQEVMQHYKWALEVLRKFPIDTNNYQKVEN